MRTYWDAHPELETSSMLLAPTLEEHYKILASYFDESDKILDVGCGDGSFSRHIPNSIGVNHKHDLFNFDLTPFNTLHFSESVGNLPADLIERLLSSPSINKVVFKDFLCTNRTLQVAYFSYRMDTLYSCVMPLLNRYGYWYTIKSFVPNRDRWKAILAKHKLEYFAYPEVKNVILVGLKGNLIGIKENYG